MRMHKWGLVAVAAFLSVACATTPPPAAPTLQLVDLTDDFARIHDRDAALPDPQRVQRFKAEFASILPGFYDEKRVEAPPEKYDAMLLKGIKGFPQQRAGIERVSHEFSG